MEKRCTRFLRSVYAKRVGNQRNIKVVLKDESQKINEVVVVGYGHANDH